MSHAIKVHRIQATKRLTIHEVREDVWQVRMNAFKTAIYQRDLGRINTNWFCVRGKTSEKATRRPLQRSDGQARSRGNP